MDIDIHEIERYIRNLFAITKHDLLYHDIQHTEGVVKKVIEASEVIGSLTQAEKDTLVIAAWFHDVGYLFDYDNHEDRSISIAREYLNQELDEASVSEIIGCIENTKMAAMPKGKLQAILKDIDIAYGLYTDFNREGNRLRKEIQIIKNLNITNEEWDRSQKRFINKIIFFSDYGISTFSDQLLILKTHLNRQKV